MEYTLTRWKAIDGNYCRVYVNGKWIKALKMYFDCWNGREVKLHYNYEFIDYPKKFDGEPDPAQALADFALSENEIDPDDFKWEDIWDKAQ